MFHNSSIDIHGTNDNANRKIKFQMLFTARNILCNGGNAYNSLKIAKFRANSQTLRFVFPKNYIFLFTGIATIYMLTY
jgi:hypothetical protein